MHAVILTGTFPPYRGGIGNAAFHEATELARAGHQVTVITPAYRRWADALSLTGESLPFHINRLPTLLEWGNAAYCPGIGRACMESDAILLHYPFFGGAECLVTRLAMTHPAKRPRLVLRYDLDADAGGWLGMLFKAHNRVFLPWILNQADKIVFSTLDYGRHSHAARFLTAHPERCVEIPYGVDSTMFFPDPSATKDPNLLLFVGGLDRAHNFKGLPRLLNAFAILLSSKPNAKLHVVGSGDLLPQYREQATQIGIGNHVNFFPSCDNHELRCHYTSATATVLPSIGPSESFGMVLIESLACGTAIVIPDLPGVRTIAEGERNGWIIPKDKSDTDLYSTADLADTLRKALANTNVAATRSRSAVKAVVERYHWTNIAGKLAGLMDPDLSALNDS